MFNLLDLMAVVGVTANSTEYGNTQATPRVMNDARTWHGRVRCQYSTYTFAAASAGSVISMCEIPKDSRIVDAILQNAALGTSVTATVGDSGDADRLISSTSMAAAAITRLNNSAGLGYVTTAATVITVTTAGAAATGAIQLFVFYMID